MDSIQESGIDEFRRQRLEKMAVAWIGLVPLDVQIAGEHEAGVCREALGSSAELSAFHVVLERGNGGVLIAKAGVSNLIKHYDFARSENGDCLGRQIDEEVCRCG